ncbi:MAG TPA: NUDIX hydrolase [Solirubrobacteraceae bacterium]|jgi:ADP-ribose pyrophosphatase YjhB (NUDIX family)|nr:NUDIX hydrolase [Solirubrobacteraceae bacterium]
MTPEPDWLAWTRALQVIAQAGLTYANDEFDIARYTDVRRIAAELAAAHTDTPAETIDRIFATDTGHPTPKIDVRGAIVAAGRILLVRERSDGRWTLPGGWADPGESPSQAVSREVHEESGLTVRAVKLIALYDRARHGHPPRVESIYKAIFACELSGPGMPRPSNETDAAAFFRPTALPDLSLGRTTPAQIARAIAHHADPSLPTEFD